MPYPFVLPGNATGIIDAISGGLVKSRRAAKKIAAFVARGRKPRIKRQLRANPPAHWYLQAFWRQCRSRVNVNSDLGKAYLDCRLDL